MLSIKWKWILRSGMCVTLLAAAGSIRVVRAQHDMSADNTHHFTYSPIEGKGGEDISGPYEVIPDWPKPIHNDGWVMGRVAGVYAESPDRIYVATTGEIPAHLYERAWGPQYIPKFVPALGDLTRDKGRFEHMLLIFDRNGKLLESWNQWDSTLKSPNRLLVNPNDPERNIWIVDQGGAGVLKFSHDGKKLLMQITEKDVPGTDKDRFSSQDMAWLPNDDFFVTGGSFVIKFSKDGKYLSRFGKPGNAPGDLNGTHGIQIDSRRRVYVADRGNSRIQVFDENGKVLDIWPNIIAPYCMRLSKDGQHMWISDGYTQRFAKYDLEGRLIKASTWGTFGVVPGTIWGPHYFDVDSEGNLYLAEDYNARVQKFRPRKDGDPEKLVDVSR